MNFDMFGVRARGAEAHNAGNRYFMGCWYRQIRSMGIHICVFVTLYEVPKVFYINLCKIIELLDFLQIFIRVCKYLCFNEETLY